MGGRELLTCTWGRQGDGERVRAMLDVYEASEFQRVFGGADWRKPALKVVWLCDEVALHQSRLREY